MLSFHKRFDMVTGIWYFYNLDAHEQAAATCSLFIKRLTG